MTKISIVTACLNIEDYVEETIRSVLNQGASDLEYIIIDGGSTDSTYEIVARYRDGLAVMKSESDDGQYSAIQKGLNLATGEIMGWLNADDLYMPWTLRAVQQIFEEFADIDWIIGLPTFLDPSGVCTSIHSDISTYPRRFIRNGWYRNVLGGYLQQESMFWRRWLWDEAGGFDPGLRLAADFKLWTEFARHAELVPINIPLAAFRKRPGQQRSSRESSRYEEEVHQVCRSLPNAPIIWRAVAMKGVVARSLCRALILRKGTCLVYCENTSKWRKVSSVKPISRVGFRRLLLEARLASHI